MMIPERSFAVIEFNKDVDWDEEDGYDRYLPKTVPEAKYPLVVFDEDMTTNTIKLRPWNKEHVTFCKPIRQAFGGTRVQIRYKQKPLVFQTPPMRIPSLRISIVSFISVSFSLFVGAHLGPKTGAPFLERAQSAAAVVA